MPHSLPILSCEMLSRAGSNLAGCDEEDTRSVASGKSPQRDKWDKCVKVIPCITKTIWNVISKQELSNVLLSSLPFHEQSFINRISIERSK